MEGTGLFTKCSTQHNEVNEDTALEHWRDIAQTLAATTETGQTARRASASPPHGAVCAFIGPCEP